MGFFKTLFNAVVFAAGTLVSKASHAVGYVAAQVKNAYDRYRQTTRRGPDEARRYHSRMADLNDEIIDFESKRFRDGHLSASDEERLHDLYRQRERLRDDLFEAREVQIAEDIAGQKHAFDSVHVTDENIHVLLFSVGQTVMGKSCRRCNRAMRLEWKPRGHAPSFGDFFWGCAGFYDGSGHIEPFGQQDMHLFTRVDRPEFEVSARELDRILLLPGSQRNVQQRIGAVRNQKTDVYLCPEHNEPMILREKREPGGVLDQYFLSCPRWADKACKQIVKLKTAGQLSSVLEAYEGRGLL